MYPVSSLCQVSWILDPGPQTLDPGPWTLDLPIQEMISGSCGEDSRAQIFSSPLNSEIDLSINIFLEIKKLKTSSSKKSFKLKVQRIQPFLLREGTEVAAQALKRKHTIIWILSHFKLFKQTLRFGIFKKISNTLISMLQIHSLQYQRLITLIQSY